MAHASRERWRELMFVCCKSSFKSMRRIPASREHYNFLHREKRELHENENTHSRE